MTEIGPPASTKYNVLRSEIQNIGVRASSA